MGSGTFGTVYHGKWRGSDVAIKRIKKICFTGRSSEQERLVAFLNLLFKCFLHCLYDVIFTYYATILANAHHLITSKLKSSNIFTAFIAPYYFTDTFIFLSNLFLFLVNTFSSYYYVFASFVAFLDNKCFLPFSDRRVLARS